MPKPSSETVDDLNSFTKLIERRMRDAQDVLWYRGCGNADHKLVPTLFRHPDISTADGLLKLEGDLLTRFRLRSAPYLTSAPPSDWEYLLLMQHFGVPTRLLDWTENPFIGLYFALTAALDSLGSAAPSADAALWVLHPKVWNEHALRHMSYKGGPLSILDDRLRGYEPRQLYENMPTDPVAIYGTHNSPRIVAQRGAFTIFGKANDPMESLYEKAAFPASSLMQISIPKDRLRSMADSIFRIGYTDSVLFPDLDGLAREIKRHYGFGL